jgi:hypothetical protein
MELILNPIPSNGGKPRTWLRRKDTLRRQRAPAFRFLWDDILNPDAARVIRKRHVSIRVRHLLVEISVVRTRSASRSSPMSATGFATIGDPGSLTLAGTNSLARVSAGTKPRVASSPARPCSASRRPIGARGPFVAARTQSPRGRSDASRSSGAFPPDFLLSPCGPTCFLLRPRCAEPNDKPCFTAKNKKSRRGTTPKGITPRRLTHQRAPRHAGLLFSKSSDNFVGEVAGTRPATS